MPLRLKIQRSEGLLILRKVLSQDVVKRLGLLRAKKNALVIADVHFIGAVAGGKAEDKLKIPHAHAHLHAVGIGLAVVGGVGEIYMRRLLCLTHDE